MQRSQGVEAQVWGCNVRYIPVFPRSITYSHRRLMYPTLLYITFWPEVCNTRIFAHLIIQYRHFTSLHSNARKKSVLPAGSIHDVVQSIPSPIRSFCTMGGINQITKSPTAHMQEQAQASKNPNSIIAVAVAHRLQARKHLHSSPLG